MSEKRTLSGPGFNKMQARLNKLLRKGQSMDLTGDQIKEELQVTLSLFSNDDSIHYVQEVGCSHEALGMDPAQAQILLLEAAEHYFQTFLEDGELNRLSLEWREEVFEGREIRARATLTRPALDRLADEWLAQDD